MRIAYWNPCKFDESFENVAMDRLVAAGEVVAAKARNNCPPGTISSPVYKRGDYEGEPWTSRDAGRLKKSIRVVRKKTKSGKAFSSKRNVRIYAGHFTAYYAYWVEAGSFHVPKGKAGSTRKKKGVNVKEIEFGATRVKAQPFLRPAFYASMPEMKSILGAR